LRATELLPDAAGPSIAITEYSETWSGFNSFLKLQRG
jgi:hypothetical protein